MHQFVVRGAEKHHILNTGFTTISPVFDMVCIYKACVAAARKAQPLSRDHNARRMAVVTVRILRPTLSGSPLEFSIMGAIEPSQHSLLTVSIGYWEVALSGLDSLAEYLQCLWRSNEDHCRSAEPQY